MSVFVESEYPICSCRVTGGWNILREMTEGRFAITARDCSNCSAVAREYEYARAATAVFVQLNPDAREGMSIKRYYERYLLPLAASWEEQFGGKVAKIPQLPLMVPPPRGGVTVHYRRREIGEPWQEVVSKNPLVNELLRFTFRAKLEPEDYAEFNAQASVMADAAELREYLTHELQKFSKNPDTIFESFDKLYG